MFPTDFKTTPYCIVRSLKYLQESHKSLQILDILTRFF